MLNASLKPANPPTPPKRRRGKPKDDAGRDRDALIRHTRNLARESLMAFTVYTDGNYRQAWHNEMLARYLDKFVRGEIKRLILSAPPRTGKSELVSLKMPAYILGRNPRAKILSASHTADLANSFSRKLQRLIMSEPYRELFPETCLKDYPGPEMAGNVSQWTQTDKEFDVIGHGENYRCFGVGAAPAGKGGDFILIDDPIRNRKEAESAKFRDDLWEWYLDDIESRDEGGAGILVMATRWHDDDLTGRLLKTQRAVIVSEDTDEDQDFGDRWVYLNLPSILEDEKDRHVDDERGERDPRKIGETLWPWRWAGRRDDLPPDILEEKSLRKLKKRQTINPYGFSALYQGKPTPRTGAFFDVTKIKVVTSAPFPIRRTCRYWDKAATQDGGKRTAGVKMSIMDLITPTATGQRVALLVEHAIAGQWSTGTREKNIKDMAETDGKGVTICIEQEPGSAGVDSAQSTVGNLFGFHMFVDKVTGDKETRAEPLQGMVDNGLVYMLNGDWNLGYKDELRAFPRGAFKDLVDASSGACNYLAGKAGASFDDLLKD